MCTIVEKLKRNGFCFFFINKYIYNTTVPVDTSRTQVPHF